MKKKKKPDGPQKRLIKQTRKDGIRFCLGFLNKPTNLVSKFNRPRGRMKNTWGRGRALQQTRALPKTLFLALSLRTSRPGCWGAGPLPCKSLNESSLLCGRIWNIGHYSEREFILHENHKGWNQGAKGWKDGVFEGVCSHGVSTRIVSSPIVCHINIKMGQYLRQGLSGLECAFQLLICSTARD